MNQPFSLPCVEYNVMMMPNPAKFVLGMPIGDHPPKPAHIVIRTDHALESDGNILVTMFLHQSAFGPGGKRPYLDNPNRYCTMRMKIGDYQALPTCRYRLVDDKVFDIEVVP